MRIVEDDSQMQHLEHTQARDDVIGYQLRVRVLHGV
jgi:hypothetical protein